MVLPIFVNLPRSQESSFGQILSTTGPFAQRGCAFGASQTGLPSTKFSLTDNDKGSPQTDVLTGTGT